MHWTLWPSRDHMLVMHLVILGIRKSCPPLDETNGKLLRQKHLPGFLAHVSNWWNRNLGSKGSDSFIVQKNLVTYTANAKVVVVANLPFPEAHVLLRLHSYQGNYEDQSTPEARAGFQRLCHGGNWYSRPCLYYQLPLQHGRHLDPWHRCEKVLGPLPLRASQCEVGT